MYCGYSEWGTFTPSGYDVKLIDKHTVYVRGGI
jgi:hypothetical protein